MDDGCDAAIITPERRRFALAVRRASSTMLRRKVNLCIMLWHLFLVS